jgi:hypothetical protein
VLKKLYVVLSDLKQLNKQSNLVKIGFVTIAERTHLFPSRTQKLSSLTSKVLGGQLPGRIDRCEAFFNCLNFQTPSAEMLAVFYRLNEDIQFKIKQGI